MKNVNHSEKEVLVTGASGFIGSALVERLRTDGITVHTHSRSLHGDLLLSDSLDSFRRTPIDTVYHLASESYVPESWKDPGRFYRANLGIAQTVLDFCRDLGARLIFFSTYVYGSPQKLPIDERHPVQPSNPYAHSKWLAEEMCRFYDDHLEVPSIVIRPFNIYGPGQSPRFLIAKIVKEWIENGKIIVENGKPRRDYLFISDFIEACRVIAREGKGGEIHNVGFGSSISVEEIILTMQDILGRPVPWTDLGKSRPHEINDVVCDSRLVREGLWKPIVQFKDGLSQTMKVK